MILGPGRKPRHPGEGREKGSAMKKRFFVFSLLADLLFLVGLVAIVAGIALSGNLPAAVAVAGVEMIAVGVLFKLGQDGQEGDESPCSWTDCCGAAEKWGADLWR